MKAGLLIEHDAHADEIQGKYGYGKAAFDRILHAGLKAARLRAWHQLLAFPLIPHKMIYAAVG